MDDRWTHGDDDEPGDGSERGLEARLAWAVMLLTLAVGSVLMVAR
jgi:hypothetical protein